MTTIERVREWLNANDMKHDNRCVLIVWNELYDFFDTLAAERCVWVPWYYKSITGPGGVLFISPGCQPSGTCNIAQDEFDYAFCPYCGKQIDVKEADNEHD